MTLVLKCSSAWPVIIHSSQTDLLLNRFFNAQDEAGNIDPIPFVINRITHGPHLTIVTGNDILKK